MPNKHADRNSSLRFSDAVPNASSHFAVGDIVSGLLIRRCGTAMFMGLYVALNVHQTMLETYQISPILHVWKDIPPMIGLAIGKQAVCYSPDDGLTWGEEVMKNSFGDDLSLKCKCNLC